MLICRYQQIFGSNNKGLYRLFNNKIIYEVIYYDNICCMILIDTIFITLKHGWSFLNYMNTTVVKTLYNAKTYLICNKHLSDMDTFIMHVYYIIYAHKI